MEEDSLANSTPTPSPTNVDAPAPSPQKPLPRFDSVSPREWFAVPGTKRSRDVNRKQTQNLRERFYGHPPAGLLDAAVFVSCYECGGMLFFRHANLVNATSTLKSGGWTVSYPKTASSEEKARGAGLWLCPECLKAMYAAEAEAARRADPAQAELEKSAPKV